MTNTYTIQWLDEHKQVYDELYDCDWKEVSHFKYQAKYYHLCIRVLNTTQCTTTTYNYLPAELYCN